MEELAPSYTVFPEWGRRWLPGVGKQSRGWVVVQAVA